MKRCGEYDVMETLLSSRLMKKRGLSNASETLFFLNPEAAKNVLAAKNIGKTLFENLEAAKILHF